MDISCGTVLIKKCADYDLEKIKDIIKEAFDLAGGIDKLIFDKKNILIKPNLVMPSSPENACVTHPSLVEAAVALLVEKVSPDMITIADSPGGPYTELTLRPLYSSTGIFDIAKRYGVKLGYDTTAKFLQTKSAAGTDIKRINIISAATEADLIINICKLKTHCFSKMSGAVKNLYGCIPGLEKAEYHAIYPDQMIFGKFLATLCETINPAISIVDAVIGMEGDGPTSGRPKFMGFIGVSINPFALDLACSAALGYKPEEIGYLKEGTARGYCPDNADKLEIIGEGIENIKVKDLLYPKTKKTVGGLMQNLGIFKRAFVNTRPVISERCVGCGVCVKCCPKKIIEIENKKAVINNKKCIKCYCCHELCPKAAVDIKDVFFFKR